MKPASRVISATRSRSLKVAVTLKRLKKVIGKLLNDVSQSDIQKCKVSKTAKKEGQNI